MKKIIIIGAGFAGLSCARRLSGCSLDLEVILLDSKGEFNFLPLLPDCLGRGINPAWLAKKVSELCRGRKICFIQQKVNRLDLDSGQLSTDLADYTYDYLVIASGSQTNFFSNAQAAAYGYPLNNLKDLAVIKRSVEENKFDNLVICGAGYTGVEAATNLKRYFKNRGISKKIILVERAPAILGALPDWMREYVAGNLKVMGIEVLTNTVIEKIYPDRISLSGNRELLNCLLIWVPGVSTADFIQKLNLPKNPQGRLVVDKYLRIRNNCFCAGDAAFFSFNNNTLRMAVQFALTQGEQVARNIIASIKRTQLKVYRPVDLGYIIPLANNHSCGRVLGLNISGPLATFLHFSMCIFRTPGLKNKLGIINHLIKGGK